MNRSRDGVWKKDHQSIELLVDLTPIEGFVPNTALVEWTVDVPNDPTNDRPDMHVQWGAYLEPSDYAIVLDGKEVSDASGGADGMIFKGAGPGVNRGVADHSPIWEATGGFSLSSLGATSCRTTVVMENGAAKSGVILHCPNLPGDRVRVRFSGGLGEIRSGHSRRSNLGSS